MFTPRADQWFRWLLAAVALVLLLAGLALTYLPYSNYYTKVHLAPSQPVPFSHQHHVAGLGIDCRYCHTSVEHSATAGMPTLHICMTCHSQVWTQAGVLEPVREAFMQGKPLQWRRVYDLADFAYFNHSAHINNGIGCAECHGQIDAMAFTRKASSLYMEWCLECHRDPQQHLRPPEQIFSMTWQPPASRAKAKAQQHALMQFYHIDTVGLTDCFTCHR